MEEKGRMHKNSKTKKRRRDEVERGLLCTNKKKKGLVAERHRNVETRQFGNVKRRKKLNMGPCCTLTYLVNI